MPFSRYFYIKRGTPAEVEWKRKIKERLTPARDIGTYNAYSKEGWNDEALVGAKESDPANQMEALLRDAEEPGAGGEGEGAKSTEEASASKKMAVEKPQSRITEADKEGDQQSLNRMLQRTLYLLVKNEEGKWEFPSSRLVGREGLNKAAERIIFEAGGPDMNTWVVGHVPVGHFARDFPTPSTSGDKSAVELGQKTFFMKARIMAGQANLEATTLGLQDFKWLAKEEIQKLVTPSIGIFGRFAEQLALPYTHVAECSRALASGGRFMFALHARRSQCSRDRCLLCTLGADHVWERDAQSGSAMATSSGKHLYMPSFYVLVTPSPLPHAPHREWRVLQGTLQQLDALFPTWLLPRFVFLHAFLDFSELLQLAISWFRQSCTQPTIHTSCPCLLSLPVFFKSCIPFTCIRKRAGDERIRMAPDNATPKGKGKRLLPGPQSLPVRSFESSTHLARPFPSNFQDSLTFPPSATMNTPLPPSVEKAYHTKCIELKRRLNEIEEANDASRIRKRRLDRAIDKLRLERAFLYDKLAKTQQFLPDDSDKDTSPPPTVYIPPSPSLLPPPPQVYSATSDAAASISTVPSSLPCDPCTCCPPAPPICPASPGMVQTQLSKARNVGQRVVSYYSFPELSATTYSLVSTSDLRTQAAPARYSNSLVSASDLRKTIQSLHKDANKSPQPQERPSRKPRALNSRANGSVASPVAENSVLASSPVGHSSYPPHPPQGPAHPPITSGLTPAPLERVDHRSLEEIPESEPLPAITWLPHHTNVIMIGGEPKTPPWSLRDIAPRHHLRRDFEQLWPPAAQYDMIQTTGYLPYDIHGNPVLVRFIGEKGQALHIFRDNPRWKSPIIESFRTDDPWASKFGDYPSPIPDHMPRAPYGTLTGPDAGALGPGQAPADGPPPSRDGSAGGGFSVVNT
ncbi:hypothetical protein FH972_023779 [Carpinus fangiana]|uniref:Large ribosomal subunit protein mL46 n=1 Tax=Carpinus fangiana TaxID=176857 RepID=A0A5N6KW58_9ROSI|nr:hypothetical protein FH972_023779 [Carpinus fangiana]